jgi:hypothetical protein
MACSLRQIYSLAASLLLADIRGGFGLEKFSVQLVRLRRRLDLNVPQIFL